MRLSPVVRHALLLQVAEVLLESMLSGTFASFIGTPLFAGLRQHLQSRVQHSGPASVDVAVPLLTIKPYSPGAADVRHNLHVRCGRIIPPVPSTPILSVHPHAHLRACGEQGLLGTLEHVLNTIPVATSLVNVQVAGLPLMFVNEAWVTLTGYSTKDAIGRNCRLLQGAATEEGAVAQLLVGIRERRACTVCLTNYRKDGSRFRNALTLHPLCDSNGEFRYMLGLASDADAGTELQKLTSQIKRLLPTVFDSSLAPPSRRVALTEATVRVLPKLAHVVATAWALIAYERANLSLAVDCK